jgi:hypothetical protein
MLGHYLVMPKRIGMQKSHGMLGVNWAPVSFVEGKEGRRFWGACSSTAEAFELIRLDDLIHMRRSLGTAAIRRD